MREVLRRARGVTVGDWLSPNGGSAETELHETALRLLRTSLNDPTAEFRDGQWESIRDLALQRQRLLLVQRTGWGKSLVYFIATALTRQGGSGPALLISPLLSLMRNQLLAAERIGIRAATINSSNRTEWAEIEQEILADNVDILLISPERLAKSAFNRQVLEQVAGRIGLFIVDEAHCISDWGHDFRPDYRRIVRVLQFLPRNVPVLATTATANDRVVTDIEAQLGRKLRTIRGPLARQTLQLQTIKLESHAPRLAWLAEYLPDLPGAGIIYTLTIRDAEIVAGWLRMNGIAAEAYFAGLDTHVKENLEERLLDNDLKVLVATVALGMGFDKPDLGFVIHFQKPGSLIHLYQQIGRAGRAIDSAYAILLHGDRDNEINDYFIRNAFPPEESVSQILELLNEAPDGLLEQDIERRVNLKSRTLEGYLRYLSNEDPAPVERIEGRWYATPVRYRFDRDRVERVTEQRYVEREQMSDFVTGQQCLMQFLLNALNDPHTAPCGQCDVCREEPLLPPLFSQDLARKAHLFLKSLPVPFRTWQTWPAGLRTHSGTGEIEPALLAEPGYALCQWGDSGWGPMVGAGKLRVDRFDDQLVDATVNLIRYRWRPQPAPEWLTCVPSRRHPRLVHDFSQRLAVALDIPFVPCIRKLRETPPQKEMQNSYQQAKNLDGAFAVDQHLVRNAPVLLVDDIVDSGWTFTVIAALLRGEGSGPVFPTALANSRSR